MKKLLFVYGLVSLLTACTASIGVHPSPSTTHTTTTTTPVAEQQTTVTHY